jgi:hypothetical protein
VERAVERRIEQPQRSEYGQGDDSLICAASAMLHEAVLLVIGRLATGGLDTQRAQDVLRITDLRAN